ncbi:MAG: ABC transporter permease [Bauldia sp.]|nr:ABC transporter permease [Bauldia sp.]
MSANSVSAKTLTSTAPASDRAGSRINEYAWIWVATVALFAASAVIAPGSVTPGALRAMLPFAGILAIVSVGQTLVIQQRGLDMSVVGAIALAGVLVATWGFEGRSLWIAVPASLLVGAAIGVVNGLLVSRVNITPIVTTLATNALIIGLVREISHGAPVTSPTILRDFGGGRLYGVPYSVLVAIVFTIVVAILMNRTVLGHRFVAVGVNPRAAEAAGIVSERYQVGAYAFAGFSFAIAGILLAGFIGNASPAAGIDYLLPGVAAVVVGGTPFTGGRGSVVASAVAALFMIQLGQMVLSMGASPALQLFIQALAIVVATGIRTVPNLVRGKRA